METDLAIDPAGNVWVMNNWEDIGACFHRLSNPFDSVRRQWRYDLLWDG